MTWKNKGESVSLSSHPFSTSSSLPVVPRCEGRTQVGQIHGDKGRKGGNPGGSQHTSDTKTYIQVKTSSDQRWSLPL